VGCAGTIFTSDTKAVENLLQLVATRDDNACVEDLQLEKNAKIIEVANEGLILRIPFKLKTDEVLVTVDLVRTTTAFFVVNVECGLEFLFFPAPRVKRRVQRIGDLGLPTTSDNDFALLEDEAVKNGENIAPFSGVGT